MSDAEREARLQVQLDEQLGEPPDCNLMWAIWEIERLRVQVERYEKALEFYADPDSWLPDDDNHSAVGDDRGEVAIKALEER